MREWKKTIKILIENEAVVENFVLFDGRMEGIQQVEEELVSVYLGVLGPAFTLPTWSRRHSSTTIASIILQCEVIDIAFKGWQKGGIAAWYGHVAVFTRNHVKSSGVDGDGIAIYPHEACANPLMTTP